MKKGLIFFVLLETVSVLASPFSFQPEVRQGIDYYFQEDFPRAEATFLELIQADTLDPAGYYFLAMTFQAEMLDLESDFKAEQFYAALEKSIQLSEKRLEIDQNDKMACLCLGNCFGSWAFQQARQGNWFSAFKLGLKARDQWSRAIRLDPRFYEAYAGLGSYLYWKSVFTKRFSWVPFIRDNRQQGIRMLTLAAESSAVSQDIAKTTLMWVNFKEKNFSQALDLASYFQNKYPEAKFPLWAEGFIYYGKSDWPNALEAFKKILARLQESQPSNYYNLIEAEFRLANCYFNLGRYDNARALCDKILAYPLDKKTKEKQREKLKKTGEILKMASRGKK